MDRRKIALISTGGTIEKTYDQFAGVLANHLSNLDVMLSNLQIRGVDLWRVPLMNKDSLEMDAADHALIAKSAHELAGITDGVVVVHGTDRLAESGEQIVALGDVPSAVVLTGAMRPFEMRNSDALQNLTEALCAVQILPPGVYAAFHNRVLAFPGVVKDRESGTFIKVEPA